MIAIEISSAGATRVVPWGGRRYDAHTVGARNETGHSRVIFTVRLVYHGPSDRGNVCLP